MKAIRNSLLPLVLIFSGSAFSQSIIVSADPSSATLAVNCNTSSKPVKVKGNQAETAVLAFMPGYTTQGITSTELAATGKTNYTIKLTKIKKLDAGFNSRKIEFTKIADVSGKIGTGSSYIVWGGYQSLQSVKLDDPKNIKEITTALSTAGYKMVGTNSMFTGKSDIPELALAGEITWFSKDTRGRGFQISVLIHWSVFSISKENVVYETTTGGYSDSDNKNGFPGELMLAIKDALAGIIYDKKFQDLAAKKSEAATTSQESVVLPKPTLKKMASYSAVVKESIGSVVTIKTDFGIGSGFIISENGYILTNNHVINSAEKIEVVFDNGFSFEAKLVRSNEDADVALLKISGSGFKPLTLNGTDDLSSTGTEVIAIGTPENIKLGQTVTKGIISGKREFDEKVYLQTDVAINSGNSGGPLINTTTGEVIGIVAAKIKAKGVEGLGFAIPISAAMQALNLKFE
ncbi:MAG TPA: trypsin-like peptidase domain-containing protein [Chitinophagaceae bacterium]|nr:trypsin-like peptidase domain-containing protein [Chitinophagaceae bacterium]